MAGPEEMKWPQKALYTYNVQNGDKFILDEKVSLGRLRTRNSSSSSPLGISPGSKGGDSPGRISFILSPKMANNNSKANSASPRSRAARNLFGSSEKSNETLAKTQSPGGN